MEKIAFFVITFDPIKMQTHSAPHNDRLNFSFVKDEHTYFKKMARIGRNTVIYKGTFVSNQSLYTKSLLKFSLKEFNVKK